VAGIAFQRDILKKLSELSSVYIVGGAVRDAQLGIPSNDVDAVMALSLREIQQVLAGWGYKPHVIGAKQQTVSLFQGSDRVDIVPFDGELEMDALRRDFTINALYEDVRTGELRDPLNGLEDLKIRRLKACGCAADRFKEDPLRILRLVRFAVKYHMELELLTGQAALDLVPQLGSVSTERVTEELGKILILDEIDKALGLLYDLGYFQTYIPELARLKGLVQNRYHTKDAWEHTRQVVKNTPARLLLRLSALFHDLGKWETASRECFAWGTLKYAAHSYRVNEFKLIGKNLERWKPIRSFLKKKYEWVPEGKRHFLQHEKESTRLVEQLLPRFRWSMVLPGGSRGERELLFLVGHHMMGTLTFIRDIKEEVPDSKLFKKARRFAWEMGWDGQKFDLQRVENLLDLWKADFLGGKQDAANYLARLDWVQSEIRNSCVALKERDHSLDWKPFEKFVRGKELAGVRFGHFKEQVRWQVMMDQEASLDDTQFLEKEYKVFWNKS